MLRFGKKSLLSTLTTIHRHHNVMPKLPLNPSTLCMMSSNSHNRSNQDLKRSKSDAPYASATNDNGYRELNERIRSVLSHPLGVALLCAFHDNAKIKGDLPSWLNHFGKHKDNKMYQDLLEESVTEWRKMKPPTIEKNLTELITDKINSKSNAVLASHQVKLTDKSKYPLGVMDILVGKPIVVGTAKEKTSSLVIEVGLDGLDWFKKFDQAIKYLKIMCQEEDFQEKISFQKPLLLAVVTLGKEGKGDDTNFQMGVFLCSRKISQSNTFDDNFRVSLLWQSRTKSLTEASKLFGRTLAIAELFGKDRDKFENGVEGYEYLSSNCCRIEDKVLKIRFAFYY